MGDEAYQSTGLWRRTLGRSSSGHVQDVERLRSSYIAVRGRVRQLAHEGNAHAGKYTLHTVEDHCDALWELADDLLGEDADYNPLEAYVFGLALLVHDLGMAGLSSLHPDERAGDQLWRDLVALRMRERSARRPIEVEYRRVPEDIRRPVEEAYARQVHARLAEAFLSEPVGGQGPAAMLVEDSGLREGVGHHAGRVAASHWWSLEELMPAFDRRVGAPASLPREWSVDLLKLACLLRVADALHVDARRAPDLVAGLRSLDREAQSHWTFQGRLQRPRVEGGQVEFSAARPFSAGEADAWWTCFDALSVAHQELQAVDGILRSSKRQPLLAHGVAGGGDPARLACYVHVDGWVPVDARLRVSDVGWLVDMLGGEHLYGRDMSVALRELIQNAQDAVRAREALGRGSTRGIIRVALREVDGAEWLVVEDTGVGMSKQVMAGCLVDFGRSLWRSDTVTDVHPRLASSGFQAEGRYGIGFFSVFMLGDEVRVISRPANGRREETSVLAFLDGAHSRPLLREATEDERLDDGGTRVWVRMREPSSEGLLGASRTRAPDIRPTLSKLCAWLAPTSDVTIECDEGDGPRPVVLADDWEGLEASHLLQRANLRMSVDNPPSDAAVSWMQELICPVQAADGVLAGRLCLAPPLWMWFREELSDHHSRESAACLTASGLRVTSLDDDVWGIVRGRVSRLDRMMGTADLTYADITRWAEKQRERALASTLSTRRKAGIAAQVWGLGAHPGCLPVALTSAGWIDLERLVSYVASRDSVMHLGAGEYFRKVRELGRDFELEDGVVVGFTAPGYRGLSAAGLVDVLEGSRPPYLEYGNRQRRIYEPVVRGVALETWGDTMVESSRASFNEEPWGPVGRDGDKEVFMRFTAYGRRAECLAQYRTFGGALGLKASDAP